MIVPAGARLLTSKGFTPVEALEGETVHINCLPYFDIIPAYCAGNGYTEKGCEPVSQEVTVCKHSIESSAGFQNFPVHRLTNYLCCTIPDFRRRLPQQTWAFLNSFNSKATTAPLTIKNIQVAEDMVEYDHKHKLYNDCISSLNYYADTFIKMLEQSTSIPPLENNAHQFILKTEVNNRSLYFKIFKNCRLPKWKFYDSDNVRVYFTKELPMFTEPLKALSHISGMVFSVSEGLFKLYFTRTSSDLLGESMMMNFKKYNEVSSKYTRTEQNIKQYVELKGTNPNFKAIHDFFQRAVLHSLDFRKLSQTIIQKVNNKTRILHEINFRLLPLPDRNALYLDSPFTDIPVAFFPDTQWYFVHSATPRLAYVEAEDGVLYLLSTIGGKNES